MDCSIIIVNYKSAALLLDCLRTVYGETRKISFEVIVVDNASGDASMEMVTKEFPGVRWIQMDYNAGFARANNAGIRSAEGTTILLLNADTLILNSAIDECCRSLMSSDYVAAGVQLLNPDQTPQISGNYAMRGGLNYLLPLPYLGLLVRQAGTLVGVSKPNVPEARDTVEVDWINGAFLMVKKTAIEKAGLLDEDFFLYAEEAEWCSRLKRSGKLCIFGNCKVIHLQGETANATFASEGKGYFNLFDRKGLQIMLSNFVRIRKQFGAGWFLFDLLIYTFEIIFFPLVLLFDKIINAGKARYTWKQAGGYARNVFKLISYSPRILMNKPHFYKVL